MNGQWTAEAIGDLSGRLAIVTGANTGIGFVTALELARHGADVVLACRDVHKAGQAVDRIRAERPAARVRALPLDLAMLASVRTFAAGFMAEHGRLDLLVNNAGVMMPPLGRTAEGFELQFGTNHLGHFALTGLLMNRLLATRGARVVTVASLAHRAGRIVFDDLHWARRRYSPWRAYGASKLANLLFTHGLQRRLDANGATVTAVAAHPGWTQTELSRHSRWMDLFGPWMAMAADQGAMPTLRAATDPAARGGDYFGPDGWFQVRGAPAVVQPRVRARDDATAERLWQVSEDLTGVRFPI